MEGYLVFADVDKLSASLFALEKEINQDLFLNFLKNHWMVFLQASTSQVEARMNDPWFSVPSN